MQEILTVCALGKSEMCLVENERPGDDRGEFCVVWRAGDEAGNGVNGVRQCAVYIITEPA